MKHMLGLVTPPPPSSDTMHKLLKIPLKATELKEFEVPLPRKAATHTARCILFENVFTPEENRRLLSKFKGLPAEPLQVKLPFGKGVGKTNRKVCLAALTDAPVKYRYSGTDQPSFPATEEIEEVNARVVPLLRDHGIIPKNAENPEAFNGALVNVYNAEKGDHLGLHADDELDMAWRTIVGVSLSDTPWYFDIQHTASKEKVRLKLRPGSVLVMMGDMQEHWKHGIPQQKRFASGTRVSLTLRRFHSLE
jgi:alkylated DNA repair dioxygenase AlkB